MTAFGSKKPAIRVSAHVLVQLGEELVTDVEQAILECVKNAYDADSPGCKIKINTTASGVETQTGTAGELLQFHQSSENVEVQFRYPDNSLVKVSSKGLPQKIDEDAEVVRELSWKGSISIEDTGHGISAEGISGSWLVISNSEKRVSSGKKKTTPLGRTPLGDKGLGRLGSMKLGDLLLVESAKSNSSPLTTALFRWADCDNAHTVDEIPVRVEDIPNRAKYKGTRVSILGLRELEQWARPDRALEITKSLARLISPFEAKSQFPVTVDVNGHKTSLVAVTDTLLSRAIAEFHFKWKINKDGTRVLDCRARFKEKLFRSSGGSAKQQEKSAAVFDEDNGKDFLEWLGSVKRLKRFSILPRPSPGWFVELRQEFLWDDIVPTDGSPAADPGLLSGAFYYFHLNELGEDRADSALDASLDIASVAGMGIDRSMIKEMAGVSILRDGFRVRSSGDWLRMSEGMTTGSTYNLRYHNTLGFFSLTGEDNDGLVEKSDREGFVENAPYRGFMTIAETCKAFSNEAIENIRRAQDKYTKEQLESDSIELHTPERSLSLVDETLALAASAQQGAKSLIDNLNLGIAMFEKSMAGGGGSNDKAVSTFKSALLAANTLQRDLSKSARGSSAVKVLRNELSDSKERMLSLYESAAVGLSARGLAHELRTHLIEIRKRATALENVIKSGSVIEANAMPHLRAIRASCGSISNAASLIDPLLPRARSVKETINLQEFIEEYIAHRKHSLDQDDIGFSLECTSPCVVKMNRGRLLQVLDNLMRNSVYWLRRGSKTMSTDRKKQILIAISRSGFTLCDSGPGVDPNYEDAIFEMFVSAKPPKERGQGLGLFIITQLLAADGAEIYLSPDRNPDGRRYKFVVNLSSVVEKGKY